MRTLSFRKTVIALAITAATLPPHALAQTLELADAGVLITHAQPEDVEVNGTFAKDDAPAMFRVIDVSKATLDKSLTVNASIQAAGAHSLHGIAVGDRNGTSTTITSNLNHLGSVTIVGDNPHALSLDRVTIEGALNNSGTLSVEGKGGAKALSATGLTTLKSDLNNAVDGRLLAQGDQSTGIQLWGAKVAGQLDNKGRVQASGERAIAIDFQQKAELKAVENSGAIIATGSHAIGLNLGEMTFANTNSHITNSGLIQAEGSAIVVGAGLDLSNGGDLQIINSGTLSAGNTAIDARNAGKPVDVFLNDGSQVRGHLLNLSELQVTGNVQLLGDTNITMAANPITTGHKTVHVGHAIAGTHGHLSLDQAHTTITGNLDIYKDSSLSVNLNDSTQANLAILAVSEKIHLDQDSQINVHASGGVFSTEGLTRTLVQANDLDDQGVKVALANPSALLQMTHNVDTVAHTVEATVALKNEAAIAAMVEQHGASTNSQKAVVRLAHDGILANLPSDDAIFAAFANADEKQLAELARQLTPQVSGGAFKAATTGQTLISNTAAARTSAVRGQSSGNASQQTGLWMQSLYSDATQGMRDGIAGYNAHSRGMSFGADAKLNDQLTLGAAYSYLDTDINGKSGNKTQAQGHAFTLYSGLEHGNYFLDGSLTYGLNDNEGKRTVVGTQAKADYDSRLLGINMVGGYTYQINPQLLVEPRLGARYSLVNIDSYREKGSSAALKVDSQRYEVLELGAGLRVAGSVQLGQGTLVPQATLMAFHDFAADQVSSTSTFVLGNTPFVTTGAKAVRNSYEAGVGADYKLGAVTLGLNYDYVGKSGFDADTLTAKIRYDF